MLHVFAPYRILGYSLALIKFLTSFGEMEPVGHCLLSRVVWLKIQNQKTQWRDMRESSGRIDEVEVVQF